MKTINYLIEQINNLNAKKEFRKIINLLDDNTLSHHRSAELYSLKSQALYREGHVEQSNAEAQKALVIDGRCVLALHYAGNYLFYKGNYQIALNIFHKALRIDPNHVITYNSLGNTYMRLGNDLSAFDTYIAGLKLAPKNEYLHTGLGNIYFAQGQFNDAKKYYNRAIECNSEYDAPYNGLGNIARKMNDLEEAISNYKVASTLAPKRLAPIFNIAMVLFDKGDFKESLRYFKMYQSLSDNKSKTNSLIAERKIQEIENILSNIDYKEVSEIIREIKATLRYTHNEITHYTSFSTTKELLLENSKFRVTEGTFLNDPAEGSWLFRFLSIEGSDFPSEIENPAKQFVEKPFIGSFVSDAKHDDLTLWRMYGKENKDEATGCAITVDVSEFIQRIKASIETSQNDEESNFSNNDLSLYRVAYVNQNNDLVVPGLERDSNENLKHLLDRLKKKIDIIKKKNTKSNFKDTKEISVQLNSIAFLFKSHHYQYENEIRLVLINPFGFHRIVEKNGPSPRVYISLTELSNVTTKITFGPKVQQCESWASVFYHTFTSRELYPEIFISTIPFK